MTRSRWIGALAAFALCGLSLDAGAGIDVQVGKNDLVTGTNGGADDVQRFRVRLPAGAKLIAVVKGKKDKKNKLAAPVMRMRVLDEFEDDVVEDGFLDLAVIKDSKVGSKAKIKVEDSGEYIVEVFGATRGLFTFTAKWTSPGKATLKDEFFFEGDSLCIDTAVDEDSLLTIKTKKSGKSTAQPFLDRIEADEDDYELNKLAKQKNFVAPEGGDIFIVIGNAAGEGKFVASAKIKPPKAKRRKIALTEDVVKPGGGNEKAAVGRVVSPAKDVLVEADDEDVVGVIVGSSVLVPAGAVTQPSAILIGTSPALAAPTPAVGGAAGPTVFFGPEGLEFEIPVTITIPFDSDLLNGDDTSGISVFTRDEDGIVSEITEFTVDTLAGTVTFAVSHFSSFRVFLEGLDALFDLDGDGVDDLIIPAAEANGGSGRVYVFSGGPIDDFDVETSQATYTLSGLGEVEAFGSEHAVGDLTGDGQPDLVVFGDGVADGSAYVFAGGSGFATEDRDAAEFRIDGAVGFGGFSGVAIGDLNGDGTADLAISGEDGTSGEGEVVVFFGGAEFRSETTTGADARFVGEEVGDLFGAALAIGEVTGDSTADLIIGADMIDNPGRTGAVYVVPGAPALAGTQPSIVLTGSGPDAGFGLNIAVGDVTGDGQADIIASEFDEDIGGDGAVHVFFGGPGLASIAATSADATYLGNLDDVLGSSLQIVDLAGAGVGELVLGAEGGSDGDGVVYIVAGGAGVTGSTNSPGMAVIFGEGFFEGFPIIAPSIRVGGVPSLVLFAPGNEDLNLGGGTCYVFAGDPRPGPSDASDAEFLVFGLEDELIGGTFD
jgi:hypothetical protein